MLPKPFTAIVQYCLTTTALLLWASGSFALVADQATDSAVVEPDNHATAPARDIGEQRYHYELAKSALANGNMRKFQEHYDQLGDYPLVPYLDYARLKSNLSKLELEDVDIFLDSHKGSFLETRLRQQLLYQLAMKKRWAQFLVYYDTSAESRELHCNWLYARIFEHDDEALAEVGEIWQQGRSHPEACDPLFNRWRRAGGLTQDIAWVRFHNAMEAGKYSLARYVTRFLDDKNSEYADLYLRVHGYPYSIRKMSLFAEHSLQMQQIIAHGIKRYARKNPLDALTYWERYEAQQIFDDGISTDAKRYLATRLIHNGETPAAESLIANSRELRASSIIEGLLRESLKTESWDKVLQWSNALDDSLRGSERWLYWRARAIENLDQIDMEYGTAEHIYNQLAVKRGFYGFMAADRIGRAYALEYVPVELSPQALTAVESLPGLQRAKELWLKGSLSEARAEWFYATRDLPSNDLVAAGEAARRWGWYNQGIHAMISGNLWDHLSIRFPLAYEAQVQKVSSSTNVAPELIYAVARQESAFMENAKSSAGAMGLMQLMPATALNTARRNGIKHRQQDLFDPEHNMNLGSHYLNELLEQYGGNRILAAAAYNAGPHRVDRWISRNPQDVPIDIWIETIPFKETRGYVQNVLAFSVIYGYRMGQPRSLLTEQEANSLL